MHSEGKHERYEEDIIKRGGDLFTIGLLIIFLLWVIPFFIATLLCVAVITFPFIMIGWFVSKNQRIKRLLKN